MKTIKLKLTYDAAACLCKHVGWAAGVDGVKATAEELVLRVVLTEYWMKLCVKLTFKYPKSKVINMPMAAAIAFYAMRKSKLGMVYNAFDMAVILPIIQIIDKEIKPLLK